MYRLADMQLKRVQLISEDDTGKVIVCEDTGSRERQRYTVYVTSDHDIIAGLHRAYSSDEHILPETQVEYYSCGGEYLVVNPYVPERQLQRFYMGKNKPLDECEEISKNYILTCMTAELPWPVLYLVIKQKLLNIARDGSVYISYAIDFSKLDESITEKECVEACAEDLIEMCREKEDSIKWDLRELLEKKRSRQAFDKFATLYRDVDIASKQSSKKGLLRRIAVWFGDNKDRLFRILLVIAIVLVSFTIITLLTNAIFGDVPWLRFFIRSFEHIGLENLVR